MATNGRPITLVCTDTTVRGAIALNWMAKSLDADEWKLVLSASERKEFSGGASKASMRLTDPKFQDTGVFSLSFLPRMEDCGLYLCSIKQQETKLKERIILLAILTGRKINRFTPQKCLYSLSLCLLKHIQLVLFDSRAVFVLCIFDIFFFIFTFF